MEGAPSRDTLRGILPGVAQRALDCAFARAWLILWTLLTRLCGPRRFPEEVERTCRKRLRRALFRARLGEHHG